MTAEQIQKKWGADLAMWLNGEMCADIVSVLRETSPCFKIAGVSEVEIQAFGAQRFAALKAGEDILSRLSKLHEARDFDFRNVIKESYPDDDEDKIL